MTARDLAYYVDGLVEGRRGTLVQRQKDRSVWYVEEAGTNWYAKRGVTPKRRREIRREAENARALFEANFGATVLATGVHHDAQWLVTEDAGISLMDRVWWERDRDALVEAARIVRSFYDRGWAFPDLTDAHLRAEGPGNRLVFIDAARVERGLGVTSPARRARDLARLFFSFRTPLVDCERWSVTTPERVRMAREVSGLTGDGLRRFLKQVDTELLRLVKRTRWRHRHIDVDHKLLSVLGEHGAGTGASQLVTFVELLAPTAWTVVRTLPDRENRSIGRVGHGPPTHFAKVYPPTKSAGWSPAMREVAAIDLFQRAGILVNRLAAYAEDVDKGSMVAVKAAAGEPLDDLLRRGVSVAERRALAVQTARIWRRMRECGLRHRDAYPCHLFAAPWTPFVVPASAGSSVASRKANDPAEAGTTNPRFELRLIDLTRAGQAPFPKERWFVKDAAALWHGLPKPQVTRTDAVRWLREYFRIPRLDARAKRFARRVAAKEARISARQARKAKR